MVGKEIESQTKHFERISKTRKVSFSGEREKKPREELGRGNPSNCGRNLLN